MIHYFYGTLQVGIGQTLCSFEHVSCYKYKYIYKYNALLVQYIDY